MLLSPGDKVKEITKIKVTEYTEDHYTYQEFKDITTDLTKIEKPLIKWIDIYGLAQVEIIEEIGKQFNLHPLVLEDILSPNQRPKLEDYGSYIFAVLKKLYWNHELEEFDYEQISLVLGENFKFGYVTVPEFHEKYNGKILQLALAIFPSYNEKHAPDPIVMNTSGPGKSNMDNFVPQIAAAQAQSAFYRSS